MTLRIALRDGEKVVVNGAVMQSVGRTELRIQSRASILRGREIMNPDEATTPARQLYFHTMMAYIAPDAREAHQREIVDRLAAVTGILADEEGRAAAMSFARNAASARYYHALGDCRALMTLEERVLAGEAAAAA